MKRLFSLLLLWACTSLFCAAQSMQIIDANDKTDIDKKSTPARKAIDEKRGAINYGAKEAMEAGRDYVRQDPTYYVGYLYQGAYLYETAADAIGYRNALPLLEKSIALAKKDYNSSIKMRTDAPYKYIKVFQLHRDVSYAYMALYESYIYSDSVEKAWQLVRNYLQLNLQDELFLEGYNMLAWTVHRNRYYTNAKYSFLKKNVADNEAYAQKLLDSASKKIVNDAAMSGGFFSDFAKRKQLSVFHYKAILYGYALNIPSTEYYFNEMKKAGTYSENNYANFMGLQAKWKVAENYYSLAKNSDGNDKHLKEYIYFQGIIDCYKGQPKKAFTTINDYVKKSNATPGYGWYQLSLARAMLNDGEYAQATKYASKAENFREVHIGTTLGQSQYDFTTNVIQLMAIEQEQAAVLLKNKRWYFSPEAIWKRIVLGTQRLLRQYVIINQFSENPERDNVVYKLMSSESTVTFDEVWSLVKDYSTAFFIKKYKKEIEIENRPLVKKYMQLVLAKLYLKESNCKEANNLVAIIENDNAIDTDYEKLFLYRLAELKMMLAKEEKQEGMYKKLLANMYSLYPQWAAYNSEPQQMKMQWRGGKNSLQNSIYKQLQASNIIFTTVTDSITQQATVVLDTKQMPYTLQVKVQDGKGATIANTEAISFTTDLDAANKILLLLFNIGNAGTETNIGKPAKKTEEKSGA